MLKAIAAGKLRACVGVPALLVLLGGCTAPHYDLEGTSSRLCADGLRNGSETDIDCGGSECSPCDAGEQCEDPSDCASGYCGDAGICERPHCSNRETDEDETDTDCGGGDCRPCAPGMDCVLPRDCDSLVCAEDVCQEPSCADDVKNGSETGKDCGGDCEALCADGASCAEPDDCESGVCSDAVCQPPSCDDNVHNGNETAVDCGGGDCREARQCSIDEDCATHTDCAIGWCDPELKVCAEPTCEDDYENGTETDRDCGGDCDPCETGFRCEGPNDCVSVNCLEDVCAAPTCEDEIKNQGEGGVDCGGSSTCEDCADGSDCAVSGDCVSGVCSDEVCQPPSCTDQVKNGLETDVDCGGGNDCPRCEAQSACLVDGDCIDGHECPEESHTCLLPACANGVLDEGETDQDCGGEACFPCVDDMNCLVDTDCVSLVCDADSSVCLAPTCTDGAKNGDEPYADCGGSDPECARCPVDYPCFVGTDCDSKSCGEDADGKLVCRSPTCEDGVQNGDELGLDCRGTTPISDSAAVPCSEKKCAAGQPCVTGEDCESAVCADDVCQPPLCNDLVLNGVESDTDCGGPCPPCADDHRCSYAQDCVNKVCTDNICLAPTCDDGVQNGEEPGTDCGGPTTPCPDLCPNGEACDEAANCESGVCQDSLCIPPICEDLMQNSDETDIDCGGLTCGGCEAGQGCRVAADCLSFNCGTSGLCIAPTCSDSIANQDESDVDCGGPDCPGCGAGKECREPADCESLVCVETADSGVVCRAASCLDQTKNQGEGDVDCGGGVCTRCLEGRTCAVGSDCRSGLCDATAELCLAGEVETYLYTGRTTQDIHIYLQVKNVTANAIDLSDYVLRYYFAHEPTEAGKEPNIFGEQYCTVTLVDEARSQGGFALWHADIEPAALTVAPNAMSAMLYFRIYANVSAVASLDETNDYSWGPQTEFTEEPWLTIPAWRGTDLVFGIPAP